NSSGAENQGYRKTRGRRDGRAAGLNMAASLGKINPALARCWRIAGRLQQGMALLSKPQPDGALRLTVANPTDMAAFADVLAPFACRGDVLALRGPLGAGKTVFARGFIEARARASGLGANGVGEVPSPTFTLVQTYDLPDTP